MKHNPQSLTSWRTATAVALSATAMAISPISPVSVMAHQETDASKAPPAAATGSPDAAAESDAGTKLVKSDLSSDQVFEKIGQNLDDVETLSCDISQSVLLSGQMFQAVGRYAQASGNRMRLEYQIFPGRAANLKDDEQLVLGQPAPDVSKLRPTGVLERVSDGSVLWTKWKNGPRQELTRRNISEIVEALKDVPNETSVKSLQSLGVGGLQTLMSQIQVGMDFGEVRELPADGGSRLVLVGRWSEKTRKDVFKLSDDPGAVLPDYVPDYVRLYVDSATMLPLRIQYLKKHKDPAQSKVRPIVTLDFRNFDLNFELSDAVAVKWFEFDREENDEIKEEDLTASVIESIKKMVTETPADDAATEDVKGDGDSEPKAE